MAIDLYGKLLPVLFVKGYIYSIEDIFGSNNTVSFCQIPINKIIEDKDKIHEWLDPLYAYIKLSKTETQPLDYAYTSLFLEGIHQTFSRNDERTMYLSKRIGRFWWFEKPPIYHTYNKYNLSTIFSSAVVDYFDNFKLSYSEKGHFENKEQITGLGLRKFIDLFSVESGILCHVNVSIDSMEIVFDECPFCKRSSLLCRTFHGVLEGFIEWMHGIHLPDAAELTMKIDEARSSSHNIVIQRIH